MCKISRVNVYCTSQVSAIHCTLVFSRPQLPFLTSPILAPSHTSPSFRPFFPIRLPFYSSSKSISSNPLSYRPSSLRRAYRHRTRVCSQPSQNGALHHHKPFYETKKSRTPQLLIHRRNMCGYGC